MTDTMNNDGQAVTACEVQKLKFSELKACLSAGGFNVDEPGGLLVIGLDGVNSQWSGTGLEDAHQGLVKLPMLAIAFSELTNQVMTNNPKALAVVAEWYGLHFKQKEKLEDLKSLLETIENA